MAVLLKIGDVQDFPSVPKNFPRCGNFYHYEHMIVSDDNTNDLPSDDELGFQKYPYFLPEMSNKNNTENSESGIWNVIKLLGGVTSDCDSTHSSNSTCLWLLTFLFYIKFLF